MKNNYIVYMHVCPNGKRYVGITSKENPNHRWKNGKGYVYNDDFISDIIKYGWGNIYHEILFTKLTQESARKIEQDLIKKYNTNTSKFGYNKTYGGECGIAYNKEKTIDILNKYKNDINDLYLYDKNININTFLKSIKNKFKLNGNISTFKIMLYLNNIININDNKIDIKVQNDIIVFLIDNLIELFEQGELK